MDSGSYVRSQGGQDIFEVVQDGHRVVPDIVNVWRGLFHTLERGKLRQDVWQHAQHLQGADGRARLRTVQDAKQLIPQTFGRDASQLPRGLLHLLTGFHVDLEAQPGSQTDCAQGADRIVDQ